MIRLLASLVAFAGLLSGRIARGDDYVEWEGAAVDAIHAGAEFVKAWRVK